MNVISLTIPLDQTLLHTWLEHQLTGVNLAQLVAELSAVHSGGGGLNFHQICGEKLPEILLVGLRALQPNHLAMLLQNPAALQELQLEIFVAGSPYWEQLVDSSPAGRLANELTQATFIQKILSHAVVKNPASFSPDPPEFPTDVCDSHSLCVPAKISSPVSSKIHGHRHRHRQFFLAFSVLSAVAVACLLLIVMQPPENLGNSPVAQAVQTGNPIPNTAWGFLRTGLLDAPVEESEMLQQLAEAAEDWFLQDRSDIPRLRVALVNFSLGCQLLIDAPLPRFSAEKRVLLRERCRAWKKNLDQIIAEIDQDPYASHSALQTRSDEVIQKLSGALQRRLIPQA